MKELEIVKIMEPELAHAITKKWLNEMEKGNLCRDDQCPEAWTVRHKTGVYPILDKIHKRSRMFSHLTPSNWYGRIYIKGNDLKFHTDNPHCDYSYTITLGYSHENWPIYINGQPYEIPIGYGAFYRGCDMEHGRYSLEGDWHAQVFFHYVDGGSC